MSDEFATLEYAQRLARLTRKLVDAAPSLAPLVEVRTIVWPSLSQFKEDRTIETFTVLHAPRGYILLQEILEAPPLRDIFNPPVEAFFDKTADARALTAAFAKFARRILDSKIQKELKIAVFVDFNILGRLFDRMPISYYLNAHDLREVLKSLRRFRAGMPNAVLAAWDSSIFAGGTDQVEIFEGFIAKGEQETIVTPDLERLRNQKY